MNKYTDFKMLLSQLVVPNSTGVYNIGWDVPYSFLAEILSGLGLLKCHLVRHALRICLTVSSSEMCFL